MKSAVITDSVWSLFSGIDCLDNADFDFTASRMGTGYILVMGDKCPRYRGYDETLNQDSVSTVPGWK